MLRRLLSIRKPKSETHQENIESRDESEREKLVTNPREESGENFDEISFIVDYIGSDYVSEAQSVPLLMETLKRIKKQHTKTVRVDLVLRKGILKVTDSELGALLITAPLYAIALCAQEQLRGFETTFALNITRRRIHLCHVFEGGSRLEAASIVRSIALSFRSVARDLKEKRHETFSSFEQRRLRADSELSTVKDFDDLSRSHTKSCPLPTLQSEENLTEVDDQHTSCQVVPVQINNVVPSNENDSFHPSKDVADDMKRMCGQTSEELYKKALTSMQNKQLSIFSRCFDEGLALDSIDQNKMSLLHHAVTRNLPQFVKYLLERGADVNIEGAKDETPLHSAAGEGNRAIAKILLDSGANVRAKDRHFRTPLHYCAGNLQSLEVSYLLVEHGARIEDNDIEGVRPVDLHLELREMQNRLIQSASEAFASADISRSRSSSGCSTYSNSSYYSATRSPAITKRYHNKMYRGGSFRVIKCSPSLQSIKDIHDETGDNDFPQLPNRDFIETGETMAVDEYSGYSSDQSKVSSATVGSPDQIVPIETSSSKEDTTDSDIDHGKYTDVEHGMNSDIDQGKDTEAVHEKDPEYFSESDQEQFDDDVIKKINHMKNTLTHSHFHRFLKKDPAADALQLLVTLSLNAECQSSILANICLPKFSGKLVQTGHGVNTDTHTLQLVSKLLQNLFTVSGPTGRQKCISTGLLKPVIDLLDATEPIQSTCLSILNDLLQTDNDRDYSGTISGIPVEPLLSIIKSIEQTSDIANAFDKPRIKSSKSSDSGYPPSPAIERNLSLKKRACLDDEDTSDINQYKSHSLCRNKTINTNYHLLHNPSDAYGRTRADSFCGSVDAINMREPASLPVVRSCISRHGSDVDAKDFHDARRFSRGSFSSNEQVPVKQSSSVVARHVAMKMLAASSRNSKLQEELAKPKILKLLLDCLDDSDEEIILQATTTLANIAMNMETHEQFNKENIEECLFNLLSHSNLNIKYHSARALVYMGNVSLEGLCLFDYIQNEAKASTVLKEENGRTFIRGTTVENLVLLLTTDIEMLWSSSNATPPSPNDKKRHKSRHRSNVPLESHIITFVLTMYQTFVHPVIFMRLLIHRFRHPIAFKIFNTVLNGGKVNIEHFAPLPILHARLMRIWIPWLENFSSDFRQHPLIKTELETLLAPMKKIDGPYGPCSNRLEQLLTRLNDRDVIERKLYRPDNGAQHNILYDECSRAIRDGQLPCSDDYLAYLAGLQLYIEDLCSYGADFTERFFTVDDINSARLKQSFGSHVSSAKPLAKKIRSHYELLFQEQPSERIAKHRYIDCCQGMKGYGCRFFKVKQRVNSNRGRKRTYVTRLFGVHPKRIVVLDDRTKQCVESFHAKELRHWDPNEDSLHITTYFNKSGSERILEFSLENRVHFKEFANYILTSTMEFNYHGYHNMDTSPWSKFAEDCGTWGSMAVQLHLDKKKREENQTSPQRIRSTTTTAFAKSSNRGNRDCAQSAPTKPGTSWTAPEALSFLNLKSMLRSRGDTMHSNATCSEEFASEKISPSSISSERSGNSPPTRRSTDSRSSNPLNMSPDKINALEEYGDSRAPYYLNSNNAGKMMTCNCPPDAVLPDMNLMEFSAYELLQHPRELARQITLIDHEMFCSISSKDVLYKLSSGLFRKHQTSSPKMTVEKVANRFNQMVNWIISSVVSERNIRRRAMIFQNFVETAKQCLELRNYNSVMAIVVAALGSAPVRRLSGTKELLTPECASSLQRMENLMDSRKNHQRYRETLRTSQTPAVPYFGIYLKDLTFISDGNPDYLKGGVINFSKRRHIYILLEEIQKFQKRKYNFQQVAEIRDYLLNKPLIPEEQLHQMSKENEPAIPKFSSNPPQPLQLSHLQQERRGSILTTSNQKAWVRRSAQKPIAGPSNQV